MKRLSRRDESGVALVLTLAFLLVVAVGLAALSTYADSAFGVTKSVRSQRATVNAADAAIEAAIQKSRYVPNAGLPGDTTCNVPTAPPVNNVSGIKVDCAPLSTSGGDAINYQPRWSILALAGSAQTTEGIIATGGDPVLVKGGIYSNSVIAVGGGMNVQGDVWSGGTPPTDQCSSVVASGGGMKHCGAASPSDVNGQDPGWAPVVSDAPAVVDQTLAANFTCYPSVVKFKPGTYLTPPTSSPPGCAGRNIYWFPPGTYYFEFPTSGANSVWNLANTNGSPDVFAGTPVAGFDPTVASSLPAGAACQFSSGVTSVGVQFIFGRESRIAFGDKTKRFEVCASGSNTAQQIAIYQMPVDSNGLHAVLANGQPNACIRKQPYVSGSASTCAFISYANNSNKPTMLVHGSVYAPVGVLDINMHNLSSGQINFDLGMVVRSVRFDVSPSTNCDPLSGSNCYAASIATTRGPREVIYTASLNGKPLLRAQVQYDDGASGSTVGRRVLIKSWSVLR